MSIRAHIYVMWCHKLHIMQKGSVVMQETIVLCILNNQQWWKKSPEYLLVYMHTRQSNDSPNSRFVSIFRYLFKKECIYGTIIVWVLLFCYCLFCSFFSTSSVLSFSLSIVFGLFFFLYILQIFLYIFLSRLSSFSL